MSAGGSTQTMSQDIDPDIKNRQLQLYGDAQNYLGQTSYTPYGGALTAGPQPLQNAAQSYLSNAILGQNFGFQSPQMYGPFSSPQFGFNPTRTPWNPGTLPGEPGNPNAGGGSQEPGGGDAGNPGVPNEGDPDVGGPLKMMSMKQGWTPYGPTPPDPFGTPPPAPVAPPYDPFSPQPQGQTGSYVVGDMVFDNEAHAREVLGPDYNSAANQEVNRPPGYQGQQQYQPGYQGVGVGQNQYASGVAQNLTGYGAQTGAQGMGAYQNPYESQVVNNVVNDMGRAEAMFREGGLYSKGAGTYGGDRMAVQEGEANRNFLDRTGNVVSQLRSQGFNTAAANAQQDASRGLGAAGLNLGAANSLNQFGTSALNNTLTGAGALYGMGAGNQATAQDMINSDVGQWDQARNAGLRDIGVLQSILQGMPVGMSQTTTMPGGSLASGLFGGLLGLGGTLASGGAFGAGGLFGR